MFNVQRQQKTRTALPHSLCTVRQQKTRMLLPRHSATLTAYSKTTNENDTVATFTVCRNTAKDRDNFATSTLCRFGQQKTGTVLARTQVTKSDLTEPKYVLYIVNKNWTWFEKEKGRLRNCWKNGYRSKWKNLNLKESRRQQGNKYAHACY